MRKGFLIFLLLLLVVAARVGAECGDGVCDGNETSASCLADCALQQNFQCVDFCGDGVCQQEDCQGWEGCPCLETLENCQQDCTDQGDGEGDSSLDSGVMMYVWIGLLVFGAFLFIFIGLKVLKWLFWLLALLMVGLAIVFWFVL
ncbi:MAG: hypothetical protein KKD18_06530 [Nanoarchaeota archaeon]|nr:hypothetical protein [Nanoarchaeota archaeon]MBU0978049.1 hypothetical protein [Nanoarchaeota archaeon]